MDNFAPILPSPIYSTVQLSPPKKQRPFLPLRSGLKAASKPSRQKKILTVQTAKTFS